MRANVIHSLKPGEALGVTVAQGTKVRVVNPQGHQVVDLWAFVGSSSIEYLSMAHNRTAHYTTRFCAGDVLVSNRFMPLLRFAKDTTDGFHDSFHAACSAQSYTFFGDAIRLDVSEGLVRSASEALTTTPATLPARRAASSSPPPFVLGRVVLQSSGFRHVAMVPARDHISSFSPAPFGRCVPPVRGRPSCPITVSYRSPLLSDR